MSRWTSAGALLIAGATFACGGHEFEPPSEEERIAEAEGVYSPALFDSVSWPDPDRRLFTGNEVYAAHCRRCHGTLGRGDTDYAQSRNLDVPSIVEPNWAFGDSMEAVRREIFVGHTEGMPTWGVAGITSREIDAAAYYILTVLRPEVLGTG